ncbi:MAG: heavy metal translocating P-type ATPase [Spirochaetales bacterium]|nr:heavy metal translocating P-type ATPase [Spirochaetales bacterium]
MKNTDLLGCTIVHQIKGRVRIHCESFKYLENLFPVLSNQLLSSDAVASVDISAVSGNALIFFDDDKVHIAALLDRVEKIVESYSHTSYKEFRQKKDLIEQSERNLGEESVGKMALNVGIAALALGFDFFRNRGSLGMNGRVPGFAGTAASAWRTSLLTPSTLVTAFLSFPIARSGLGSVIKRRRPNADTLSLLSIVASLLLRKSGSALTVLLLHEIAELLTAYTVKKTRNAIGDMLSQGESSVWKVDEKNHLDKVPISSIQISDVIKVHTGEKISVDGIVIRGEASVDQSSITGEYFPVEKSSDAEVYAGTVVVEGAIYIQSVRVGDDTAVARIIKLVEDAADNKAPIQNTADRFSSQLLYVNLFLAASVFLITKDPYKSLNMLIIDYSCALRLSTVTAFSASINRAAREGILIKGSNFIESLSDSQTIIFDKTGTLTEGKPDVTAIIPASPDVTEREVLENAAAAEETSSHPLAGAILRKMDRCSWPIPSHGESEVHVGYGVSCGMTRKKSDRVYVGSRKFLTKIGVESDLLREEEKSLLYESQNVIFVARGDRFLGIIGIKDTPRLKMKRSINTLRYCGLSEIILLTGDVEQQAAMVASHMKLDSYLADQLPEDKANAVLKLQATGENVIMVGDGINDAAALAYADVGISLGSARTDIAMESADITIASDDPMKIPAVIHLSQSCMSVIKQNFATAIVVNSLGLLLGGMGILPVIGGAILHNASTIMVVGNSLRLLNHPMNNKGRSL